MFWALPADVRAIVWRKARFRQARADMASALAARAGVSVFRVAGFLVLSRTLGVPGRKTLRMTLTVTAAYLTTKTVVTDRGRLRHDPEGFPFFRTVTWRLQVPNTPDERCRPRASLGEAPVREPPYRE